MNENMEKKDDPDFLLYLKSWVEAFERRLPEIKSRIRALTLERENFQNKWVHHHDRERIINENTLEIYHLEELAKIIEKRHKEYKDYLKKRI